jgi:hypothetical protein
MARHRVRAQGGRDNVRPRARPCAEEADRKAGRSRIRARPVDRLHYASAKKRDVKHIATVVSFRLGQEFEQESGEARLPKRVSGVTITHAEPARPAAMRKYYKAIRRFRQRQDAHQPFLPNGYIRFLDHVTAVSALHLSFRPPANP